MGNRPRLQMARVSRMEPLSRVATALNWRRATSVSFEFDCKTLLPEKAQHVWSSKKGVFFDIQDNIKTEEKKKAREVMELLSH